MSAEHESAIKSNVRDACLLSAFIQIVTPLLCVIGVIWGIVYAARGEVGPALAVWASTALGFVGCMIISVLLAVYA